MVCCPSHEGLHLLPPTMEKHVEMTMMAMTAKRTTPISMASFQLLQHIFCFSLVAFFWNSWACAQQGQQQLLRAHGGAGTLSDRGERHGGSLS